MLVLKHLLDSTNFKTIKVSTGTYAEQLPIRVGRKTAIIGDNLRSVTVSPDTTTNNGDGAGISSDGSTPNNRQTMFRLNDSCTLSGMTFSGMTGQLQGSLKCRWYYKTNNRYRCNSNWCCLLV